MGILDNFLKLYKLLCTLHQVSVPQAFSGRVHTFLSSVISCYLHRWNTAHKQNKYQKRCARCYIYTMYPSTIFSNRTLSFLRRLKVRVKGALWPIYYLKCLWHEKYFPLIWKAFQNTEEWRFPFWNISFGFRDIDIFLLCKLDQWWRHVVCN